MGAIVTVISEGGVFIPRKLGWTAVVGGIMFLCTMIAGYADARVNLVRDIEALQKSDVESRARGDDIRAKIKSLEEMRFTVIRMEERQRAQDDLLREILKGVKAK
jgi:hypothetical protein